MPITRVEAGPAPCILAVQDRITYGGSGQIPQCPQGADGIQRCRNALQAKNLGTTINTLGQLPQDGKDVIRRWTGASDCLLK